MKCTQKLKNVPNPFFCHPWNVIKSSKLKSDFLKIPKIFLRTFGYGDLTSDSFRVQSQAKTTQEIHKGERKIEHHLVINSFPVLDQISHWN